MATAEVQANWRKRVYLLGHIRREAIGSQRRLQALCVAGWSLKELAEMSGQYSPTGQAVRHETLTEITSGAHRQVMPNTEITIRRMYDALWNVHPQGVHSARLQTVAKGKGWSPAQAWNDEEIDHPLALPEGVA